MMPVNNSIAHKVYKGISWLALSKIIMQIVAWSVTILVARLLLPEDYGLFAMATIITSYAGIFQELGVGAAIVQSKDITQGELTALFWFSVALSVLFALCCIPFSYITAEIMREPRVIPITQSIALVFLFSGAGIVPSNLLRKELEFKKLGIIGIVTTIISCLGMVLIALSGGGVWTLAGGMMIRAALRTSLLFYITKWVPGLKFNFRKAKKFIRFGIIMSFGRSLRYIWLQSDKFFAGRFFNATLLGYYSFALQLAQLPTEKIVTLINEVSYPAFSKLQNNKTEFNQFYLIISKTTATFVLPLFIGGFLVGEDLIGILLGEKWFPIIGMFRYLCLAQIFMSLNAVNNFVHAAQGRPHWGLHYNLACVLFMPLSFYFAVLHGLDAMVIPWLTTFAVLSSVWMAITIKKIGINVNVYLKNLIHIGIASLLMLISVYIFHDYLCGLIEALNHTIIKCFLSILVGGMVYSAYLWLFDNELILQIKRLRQT